MITIPKVGLCKECYSPIRTTNECIPDYPKVYECPVCNHLHSEEEMFTPEFNNVVMLEFDNLLAMQKAGDTLTKYLGLHSQALKAVEESAEFSQALLKFVRCKNEENLDNVFEEYFDLLATSTQIIRMLARDADTFMRLHSITGKKLNKLEHYAELAEGFKFSENGAYELEQFQNYVESIPRKE